MRRSAQIHPVPREAVTHRETNAAIATATGTAADPAKDRVADPRSHLTVGPAADLVENDPAETALVNPNAPTAVLRAAAVAENDLVTPNAHAVVPNARTVAATTENALWNVLFLMILKMRCEQSAVSRKNGEDRRRRLIIIPEVFDSKFYLSTLGNF